MLPYQVTEMIVKTLQERLSQLNPVGSRVTALPEDEQQLSSAHKRQVSTVALEEGREVTLEVSGPSTRWKVVFSCLVDLDRHLHLCLSCLFERNVELLFLRQAVATECAREISLLFIYIICSIIQERKLTLLVLAALSCIKVLYSIFNMFKSELTFVTHSSGPYFAVYPVICPNSNNLMFLSCSNGSY